MNKIREVDSSNIEEFLYEISGETHRGLFWRLRKKLTFWFRNKLEDYDATGEVRHFFHGDLREARSFSDWYMEKKGYMDLRYQTRTGVFMARRFKVRYSSGYMILTELMFDSPQPAKRTKGVLTFKPAYHNSSEFHCLGIVRCKEYWVRLGACI